MWNLNLNITLSLRKYVDNVACRTQPYSLWLKHLPSLCSVISCIMGLLPDRQNCVLCMRRGCRGRFSRHRLRRKPLVSDPAMHHGTCVTHVPWWMSGLLTRGGWVNVPGIPGACAAINAAYLIRGPLITFHRLFFGNVTKHHSADVDLCLNLNATRKARQFGNTCDMSSINTGQWCRIIYQQKNI